MPPPKAYHSFDVCGKYDVVEAKIIPFDSMIITTILVPTRHTTFWTYSHVFPLETSLSHNVSFSRVLVLATYPVSTRPWQAEIDLPVMTSTLARLENHIYWLLFRLSLGLLFDEEIPGILRILFPLFLGLVRQSFLGLVI